ncbi:hypothetical protein J1N35_034671 [Gossypium stocksii]|uniref:Uncharacterized protein n=1 Tax=Gossypium stocksii TaxID=47602 RepID=A0A9D3USS6_9ROSI|nr:hypothetical protein J1N35_034671 [Gossypium stocksii]
MQEPKPLRHLCKSFEKAVSGNPPEFNGFKNCIKMVMVGTSAIMMQRRTLAMEASVSWKRNRLLVPRF